MVGFTEKGVMLLPKEETYDSRGEDYRLYLKKSVKSAIKFFKRRGITLQCFITNEIAKLLDPKGVEWLIPDTQEDMFFIQKNVEGYSTEKRGIYLDKYFAEARKKFPTARGLAVSDRFDIVVKRDKFIANKHIADSRLIITFEHSNNPYYKVISKPEDGRIIFKVNHNNFVVNAEFCGAAFDPIFLSAYKGAGRPIYRWEEEHDI